MRFALAYSSPTQKHALRIIGKRDDLRRVVRQEKRVRNRDR